MSLLLPRMTRAQQQPWFTLPQTTASPFDTRRWRSQGNLRSRQVSDSHHGSPWKVKCSTFVHSFNKCLWSTGSSSGSGGCRESVCKLNAIRLLRDRTPPASVPRVSAWMKPEPAEWPPCTYFGPISSPSTSGAAASC